MSKIRRRSIGSLLNTAILGLLAFLMVAFPEASSAIEPSGIRYVDFEDGSCDSWLFNGCVRGNAVDTFANFGIPPLQDGGNFAASLHSYAGGNSADSGQFLYNESIPDIYLRFYFYLPTNWLAAPNPANTLKFVSVRGDGGDRDIYLFGDERLQFNNQRSACDPFNVLTATFPTRGVWHYMEVHVDSNTNLYAVWLDRDARSTNADYSHTWTSCDFGGPTKQVVFNANWSGNNSPQDQDWYIDGIKADNVPIGDTYGVIPGSPAAPTNLQVGSSSP